MRMNVDQISAYPPFALHVRSVLPAVARQKKIVQSIKNHSGATERIITEGLMWSSGPLLDVQALVPFVRDGQVYTPMGGYKLNSNVIEVSMAAVGRYQQGLDLRSSAHGHVNVITVILLHELTHWARERSGTSDVPDVEDGFEFEKEVYGRILER